MPGDIDDEGGRMIFIDAFVQDGGIVCWCRGDSGKNLFIRQSFEPVVYFDTFNEEFALKVLDDIRESGDPGLAGCRKVRMKHLSRGEMDVFELKFSSAGDLRRLLYGIEKRLRNVARFYNADIDMSEAFMSFSGLFPMSAVEMDTEGRLYSVDDIMKYEYDLPDLVIARVKFSGSGWDAGMMKAELNGEEFDAAGFREAFEAMDPDIVLINGQQKSLIGFCDASGVRLNRIGKDDFGRLKGQTFYSYGNVHYREGHLYLKGRLLFNSASYMTDDFNVYSIIEGARICRMTIQRTGSHSVGAAITNLLSWQAMQDGYLVPYKVGIYERVKKFGELVACDRGALTVEPYPGMHSGVAELDFVSMFPTIISVYNMSPETLRCGCCGDDGHAVPGTGYRFCRKVRGIVPKICDILIDRRGYFKRQDDLLSKNKVSFLKWLSGRDIRLPGIQEQEDRMQSRCMRR